MTKKIDISNIRGIIEDNYIFGHKNPFRFHTVYVCIKGGVMQTAKQSSNRDANRAVLI